MLKKRRTAGMPCSNNRTTNWKQVEIIDSTKSADASMEIQ